MSFNWDKTKAWKVKWWMDKPGQQYQPNLFQLWKIQHPRATSKQMVDWQDTIGQIQRENSMPAVLVTSDFLKRIALRTTKNPMQEIKLYLAFIAARLSLIRALWSFIWIGINSPILKWRSFSASSVTSLSHSQVTLTHTSYTIIYSLVLSVVKASLGHIT